MKRTLLSLFCLTLLFAMPADAKRKIWILGDSTAAIQTDGIRCGWAQVLQQFFNSDELEVIDRAKSGASSKSFYLENSYWPNIKPQVQAGDIVIIQFAHNDEKTGGLDGDEVNAFYKNNGSSTTVDYRGTTANGTFQKYMKAFIDETKAAGGIPIVVGPICRRYFKGNTIQLNGQHNLYQSHSVYSGTEVLEKQSAAVDDHSWDYVYNAKLVADSYTDVPFIDLTAATVKLYLSYGEAYTTASLFGDPSDGTHPSALGATLIARNFAQLAKQQYDDETDAAKKSVLKLLADNAVLTSEMSFSPSAGDLGQTYSGQTLTSSVNISAFSLPTATGTCTITASEGFEISTDNANFSSSLDVDYTGSTLIQTIYVRFKATQTGDVTGTLTAQCGDIKGTMTLTAQVISVEGGVPVKAFWDLSTAAKSTAEITGPVNAVEESYSNMYAASYNKVNSAAVWTGTVYGDNGENPSTQRNCIEGNTWPAGEIDENSTRWIQFGIAAPDNTEIAVTKVSYYCAGAGGSGMRYKGYYGTKTEFESGQAYNYVWTQSMAGNTAYYVEEIPVKSIANGEEFWLRFYPYYSSSATGKTFCLKDVTIEGVAKTSDGIYNVMTEKIAANNVYYNTVGQRVSPDTHGFVIFNGRKMIR